MTLSEIQLKQPDLPIWQALDDLLAQMQRASRLILVAPPGAGKSSIVPLALMQADWLGDRRILLLEPRRLAARNLAWRMAELLDEPVGQRVGLRTRDETRVSAATRIEVLTEALLTRRLQADPELSDVGLIIFDEFHERSLHADLGLALARDVQQGLREDLRLLLMSATLDDAGLAEQLDASVVRSEGRSYPVDVRYQRPGREQRLETSVASAIRQAVFEETGSVLVFLPGEGEIRRVQRALKPDSLPENCHIQPLYGRLPREAQQRAIAPAPQGQRKIVLATAVAETSLTIAGVRVVIDAGLARGAVYDPNAGFGHLQTRRVSRDSADQRAGRAGRLEPGVCIRLWPADEVLQALRTPEIQVADLATVALNVAAWGSEPDWLQPPPAGHWAQARDLLRDLRLIDARGRITADGRQVIAWGAHPRTGRMLLDARNSNALPMACDLAGLLDDAGRRSDEIDIHRLWLARRHERGEEAWQRESRRWRRRLGVGEGMIEADPGPLLAAAFPDRIALSRASEGRHVGRFLLANGRGARLDERCSLAGHRCLVVLALDGREEGRIRLAAEYSLDALEQQFAGQIGRQERLSFNPASGGVEARMQRRFRQLVVEEKPLQKPSPEALSQAMLDGVRSHGLTVLPWDGKSEALYQRLKCAAAQSEDWPDYSEAALIRTLDVWLAPWMGGVKKLMDLSARLGEALLGRLDGAQRQQLERLAPAAVQLAGGRRAALDYAAEDGPVLAVRMQDMYGQDATPLAGGRPVLLHLLSPARRPLAVTRDLPSFWRNAYPEVRKQMRGRYPKHHWPEQPWLAAPDKPRR